MNKNQVKWRVTLFHMVSGNSVKGDPVIVTKSPKGPKVIYKETVVVNVLGSVEIIYVGRFEEERRKESSTT